MSAHDTFLAVQDPAFLDRFWAKVEKSDACWLWRGALFNNGYGTVPIRTSRGRGRTSERAHRVAWTAERGEIPDGLFVCHRCDVRACVRPSHLFVGTATDNNHDRDRKGRQVCLGRHGESCPTVKLSEADVRMLRSRNWKGSHASIAAQLGVTRSTIGLVLRRVTWTHID